MTSTQLTTAIQRLQKQITSTILTPDDPAYEAARSGWNISVDQHPALILLAENAQDVAAGVRFANEEDLGIAVQLTGHGLKYPADGGLLILTSRMDSVEVDVQNRTARVAGGVIWQQVIDKTAEYGLAPLLGSTPHVGVVGYTVGGGIGWLARRFGLAADSVRWIEIVTADGTHRRASPTENSELFWGLRGGGGNFGVVTAMEFSLYPVARLYGGSMVFPGELTGEALRFYRDWLTTIPDELTTSLTIFKFPPLPIVPEAMRGKTHVILRAAHVGSAADGQALMQPWLDWHAPISNTFRDMPFEDIAEISNDRVDPTPSFSSNEMFDTLTDDLIEVIVRHATDSTSPLVFTELRHAGGAIARVDKDANAVGNRDAAFYMNFAGLALSPEIQTAIESYMSRYKAALQPYLRGGVYLNFMVGSEALHRTRDAYLPEAYERLLALKTKYDPDNRFRYSFRFELPDRMIQPAQN